MRKTILRTMLLLLAANLCLTASVKAQKRSKHKVQKVVEPKEDFSTYIDNPICKLMIVDSVVVDADKVLSHIPMPQHLGSFDTNDSNVRYHQNDFKTQRLYAEVADTSGNHIIYRQLLIGNKWSEPEPLHINGDCFDYINPFPMPDGQTLYFAARSEEDHQGKCYSLYTTTLDYETGEYLAPKLLPYPFVSEDYDLYYIDDEVASVAWLVTTRRQPQGKACIYTIHSQQPWSFYDTEETAPAQLKSYAVIERIADTWGSVEERNKTIRDIEAALAECKQEMIAPDNGEPVVLKNLRAKAESLERQLDEYRRMYNRSNDNRLAETIRQTEQELKLLYAELRSKF